jgi:hypothetical protein
MIKKVEKTRIFSISYALGRLRQKRRRRRRIKTCYRSRIIIRRNLLEVDHEEGLCVSIGSEDTVLTPISEKYYRSHATMFFSFSVIFKYNPIFDHNSSKSYFF